MAKTREGNVGSVPYVVPLTSVHASFDEARRSYAESGGIPFYFERDRHPELSDLAQGKRNLIVGEPGVGKSELLKHLNKYLNQQQVTAELIDLRQVDAINRIDSFLKAETASRALLLDALDEVRSSAFPAVLQKIEDVSRRHPEISIYLSARRVFISHYAKSFPEYRFITIFPFTLDQVRKYLVEAGHSSNDVDALINRVMSFSHRTLVLQIPRYLSYLNDFLETNGVEAAAKVSRNELFEYFIYSKLELEERKLFANKRAITKRVLEKLALTMEIYQTNTITLDELMTFFDDLHSDLKLVALSQIKLEHFFYYSLLKNNIDSIEFENTEFQEYLAAKEITRLLDPNRAAFSFSVDPYVREVYPTWFNTLTFLVDMQPDLLEQLIEFSGIRSHEFKIVDEGFFTFISRVNPERVPIDLKQRLFTDVIAYHKRRLQWLPTQLASSLHVFFDPSLEAMLKSEVSEAESKSGAGRFVPLSNVSYVAGFLLKSGSTLDMHYWRNKMLSYLSRKDEHNVLKRHALFALEQLGDPTVIEKLPNLLTGDELVARRFLSACASLDPNNPRCLKFFIDAVKMNELHGVYGFFDVSKRDSIKLLLATFVSDDKFRDEFLDQASVFSHREFPLIERIEAVVDDEIIELCISALFMAADFNRGRMIERSPFVVGLWNVLRKKQPGFIATLVVRLKEAERLYDAKGLLAGAMEKDDVAGFMDAMLARNEERIAFDVMVRVRLSRKQSAEQIYEAGRSRLPAQYREWEEAQSASSSSESESDKLLRQLIDLLEPEPGTFNTGVFDFYNRNASQLNAIIDNGTKQRLVQLITDNVFKNVDPGTHKLTITQQGSTKTYTTSSAIRIFRDAIVAASHLDIDVTRFRHRIINFIPFAFGEELKTIFKLIPNIEPTEITGVLKVYMERRSDLWRHEPGNLIEAAEQYHLVHAAPILKTFVQDAALEKYARGRALQVLESLIPDPSFLREIFELYRDQEEDLSVIANGLLITSYGDKDAIRWRMRQVIRRAAPFVLQSGVHTVGNVESELHNKTFAKPLIDLSRPGYEDEYLKLLDEAMAIWGKGEKLYAYATYLWDIVYAYFDNLKEGRSYDPLRILENKISAMENREGANCVAARMGALRRSYLGYLGKPRRISGAIEQYNKARTYDDKKIRTSSDLFRNLQDVMDKDLRRWIEAEGAYDLILGGKVTKAKRQEYEKLIQRTIRAQIENFLFKRGFTTVDIVREPQLYDETRTDFLVRYGFSGPIVVEVKLTSNTDLRGSKIQDSPSYKSMKKYLEGYEASHGIFLIVDNKPTKNLTKVVATFESLPNVWAPTFACGVTDKQKKTKKKQTKAKNDRGKN